MVFFVIVEFVVNDVYCEVIWLIVVDGIVFICVLSGCLVCGVCNCVVWVIEVSGMIVLFLM